MGGRLDVLLIEPGEHPANSAQDRGVALVLCDVIQNDGDVATARDPEALSRAVHVSHRLGRHRDGGIPL
jgi:hypothetical protein